MNPPEVENVALLDDEAREAEIIAAKRSSRGRSAAKGDLGSSCTTRNPNRFFTNDTILPLRDRFLSPTASRRDPRFAPRRSPAKGLSPRWVDL